MLMMLASEIMMNSDLMDWVTHTAKRRRKTRKSLKHMSTAKLKSCRRACAYESNVLLSICHRCWRQQEAAFRCHSQQVSSDELFDRFQSSSRSSNLFRAFGISESWLCNDVGEERALILIRNLCRRRQWSCNSWIDIAHASQQSST